MKTFTFKYDSSATLKNTRSLLKKTINTGVPHVEEDQLKSASLKALLSLATENRLELFRIIHNQKPGSLYELSKIFGADLSYVSKEVRVLESIGVVKLVTEEVGGRERVKPMALYDRIILDYDVANGRAS